ncbi:alpha/beta hydrolase family protein [Peristeroidobacter soli]|uniref:alpha/beta hydrolase family protein n=1 Tax=Peristeroidobacter soli TaxID=2497877 RepID=UPI00101BAC03|nr:alpha/beta fold hydrolase [Peristeroidobacter soli]
MSSQDSAASSYSRTPYLVVYQVPRGAAKEVYGSVGEHVALQAQLLRGPAESKSVIVAMHPIGSQAYLPMFPALARAGHHVICCANRYSNGDFALQFENLLLDLAACIRDARERLGYEQIVLAGWSGGGSLMAGYQAEAEQRRIVRTAADEYTPLVDTQLPKADALMLLASHRSRHHLLTDFLDASILDERDPERRDRQLDLYDAQNPHQPPYDRGFLESYRAAQLKRNRKITAWVLEQLQALRRQGREQDERAFVVHGTMADPRWLDISIDPNERKAGSYIGDPRVANNSPAALARYSSLRSWLSQWSYDHAQVDAVDAVSRITTPILVVVNGADDACPTTHTDAIYAAIRHDGKERHMIAGANHYFSGPGQKAKLEQTVTLVNGWLAKHHLGSGVDRSGARS